MSVITVIKKIGERVLSVVEWPIKHSILLVEMLTKFGQDEPKVQGAIVGLVQEFEALGPDVIEALAAKGLDLPDDLKTIADVKALFTYFNNVFLPTIESAYADFKLLSENSAAVPSTTQTAAVAAASAPAAIVAVPGLHNTVNA